MQRSSTNQETPLTDEGSTPLTDEEIEELLAEYHNEGRPASKPRTRRPWELKPSFGPPVESPEPKDRPVLVGTDPFAGAEGQA